MSEPEVPMANFRGLLPLVALLRGLVAGPLAPTPADGRAPKTKTYARGPPMPIPTDGPSWYDDTYYRQVLADGVGGRPLPSGAQPPDHGTYAATPPTST